MSSCEFLVQSSVSRLFPSYSGMAASPIALGCLGSRCFWLVTDGIHWPEFGPQCMMINGSHLASIPDKDTNTFLVGKLVPHGAPMVYLGAIAERFPWKWVNGASYDGKDDF